MIPSRCALASVSAVLVLATFAFPTSALAWKGGPFSNNSYSPSGYQGTYRGVVSGKNVSGVTSFTMSNDSVSVGRSIIFAEGRVYSGGCEGLVTNESVNAVFDGFSTTQEGSEENLTNAGDNSIDPGNVTISPGSISASSGYQVTATLNGYYDAKVKENNATFRFDGKGVVVLRVTEQLVQFFQTGFFEFGDVEGIDADLDDDGTFDRTSSQNFVTNENDTHVTTRRIRAWGIRTSFNATSDFGLPGNGIGTFGGGTTTP